MLPKVNVSMFTINIPTFLLSFLEDFVPLISAPVLLRFAEALTRTYCLSSLHKSIKRNLQIRIEEQMMTKILRRQKSGYALSLILCLVGLTALFVALWKTWSKVSSAQNPSSVFWTILWREQLDFIPGIEFKLAYLVILGTVMLISGLIVLALSRQWFHLPAGQTVLFQCPFCKKQWKAHKSQELVNCPYCRQQTYPRMVEN